MPWKLILIGIKQKQIYFNLCYNLIQRRRGIKMFVKLKEKRIGKGYTYQKMSEKLGISKAFYFQLENGDRKLTYNMAIKIADIFKVKPDTLFYDDYAAQKRKEK